MHEDNGELGTLSYISELGLPEEVIPVVFVRWRYNAYPLEFGPIPNQDTYGPTGSHFSLSSLQSFATEHPCFMEDPAWVASSFLRRGALALLGIQLG